MTVDHGFVIPLQLALDRPDEGHVPGQDDSSLRQHGAASAALSPARCLKLGRALGRALGSYPEDKKIVMIGTGGLSHQLDGERAGFINKDFDLWCMDKIVSDPDAIAQYSTLDLVRLSGAQGVELVNWLIMRGAMARRSRCATRIITSRSPTRRRG